MALAWRQDKAGDGMNSKMVDAYFSRSTVVPVVVIEQAGAAVELARTLVAAGLPLIEITLRTPAALEAIALIRKNVPQAEVGAGSVLSAKQLDEALAAGARFIVSPGATNRLLTAFARAPVPCLPGVATASEALAAREAGFTVVKFFPAEAMGGVATLKAWQGPLAGLRFCPTGGIDMARAPHYLALPNVICVGGSWMVPHDAIARGDFAAISTLARAAAGLSRGKL